MLQRTLTASVGIPVLVAAVWFGAPWLTLLVAALAVQGVIELYRLRPLGIPALPVALGIIFAISLVIGAQGSSSLNSFLVISFIILAVGAVACSLWLIAYYNSDRPLVASFYLLGGPVYAGFLLAHAIALREIGENGDTGRDWLLVALLVVFAADTGAYLVGKAFGSRPLAPVISPNKTWEGAAGGLFFALVVVLIAGYAFDLATPRWQQLVVGASVGVISQLGDLLESKLKRVSNVKHAGSIIPGHGGVLDRLDSVVVSIPLVYYLLTTVFDP